MENVTEQHITLQNLSNKLNSLNTNENKLNKEIIENNNKNKLLILNEENQNSEKQQKNKKSYESFKNKPKLSIEDKKIAINKIETFKSSYPKGQLCSYWIKGLCWMPKENCQFAHGVGELHFENLLNFSLNRKKGLVNYNEIAFHIQAFRIVIERNYFLLHEFLVENKDKIPGMLHLNYTLNELNRSSKLRCEVRKFLLHEVYDELAECIFENIFELAKKEKNENLLNNDYNNNLNDEENLKSFFMNAEEFETLIKDAGLINFQPITSKSKILKKSFVDKETKKKKTIVRLMPRATEIFENFVKIILANLKLMNPEELKKSLPLNFKLVNQLIIKSITQEEPYIFNYMNLKNISYSEFMEELKQSQNFVENLDLIVSEKNEQLKNLDANSELISKENYFHDENIDEIVIEFRAFLWEKYFNKLEQDNYLQKYGFMPFEFIKENFFNFANKKMSYHISDNAVNLIIKKILLYDKNVFFINNNFKNYVLNINYFQNLKLQDYFQEGKFEKRCDKQDEKVQKIVQDYFSTLSAEKTADEELEPISDSVSLFAVLEKKIEEWFNSNKKIKTNLNEVFDNKNEKNEENNENEISEENKSQEIALLQSAFEKAKKSELKTFTEIIASSNYEKEEIVVVHDLFSMFYFIRKAKLFGSLAIDLEGRLSSKNAEINLIQIFDESSKQIFILDVYKINYLSGSQKEILFSCLQIILTLIMESENITKVFHDGRKDLAALHCFFKCCASNFIDTSCIYSFLKQLDLQTEFYNVFYHEKIKLLNSTSGENKNSKNAKVDFFDIFFNEAPKTNESEQGYNKSNKTNNSPKNNINNNNNNENDNNNKSTFNNLNYTANHQISDNDIANLHSLINNSSSPGLNKVLESYEPNGNVNYLKDKMHEQMGSLSMKHKLFTERPINKDFLQYSAMDVKFLFSSLRNMQKELKSKVCSFYPEAKGIDFELLCRILSNDHMKTFCCYELN